MNEKNLVAVMGRIKSLCGKAWNEALTQMANRLCSCGGAGPGDPKACKACEVYHELKNNTV